MRACPADTVGAAGDAKPSKGAEQTVTGQRALVIVDRGEDGGSMYVALRGKPYPLRFEPAAGSSDQGRIDFLDYDKTFTLAKPPASQVVDIAKMSSGG